MNVLDIKNKEDYSICLETVFVSEELYMKILVVVVTAEVYRAEYICTISKIALSHCVSISKHRILA